MKKIVTMFVMMMAVLAIACGGDKPGKDQVKLSVKNVEFNDAGKGSAKLSEMPTTQKEFFTAFETAAQTAYDKTTEVKSDTKDEAGAFEVKDYTFEVTTGDKETYTYTLTVTKDEDPAPGSKTPVADADYNVEVTAGGVTGITINTTDKMFVIKKGADNTDITLEVEIDNANAITGVQVAERIKAALNTAQVADITVTSVVSAMPDAFTTSNGGSIVMTVTLTADPEFAEGDNPRTVDVTVTVTKS